MSAGDCASVSRHCRIATASAWLGLGLQGYRDRVRDRARNRARIRATARVRVRAGARVSRLLDARCHAGRQREDLDLV